VPLLVDEQEIMLTTRAILNHYQYIDPRLLDIVIELRNIVAEIRPDATETILRQGLVYFDAVRGGHVSAGICQIMIRDDCVRLAFIHGAFLPDPQRLLQSEGDRIAKRFVEIRDYDAALWKVIKDLIRAAADFDPYSQNTG
jgi:hypothetical protein